MSMVDEWHHLYKESWKGVITPEAFTHPAKFSRALIEHIYQHLIDQGWLKDGDTVVDPFGGVALGGFGAMRHGLLWVGVELEPKFVEIGRANIQLWNKRYRGNINGWGTAQLWQGDSRHLLDVVQQAGIVASSPPFQGSMLTTDQGFLDKRAEQHRNGSRMQPSIGEYGKTEGQLGGMVEGDVDGVLGSPPYAESIDTKRNQHSDASKVFAKEHRSPAGYGTADGQLGAMAPGEVDAALSSPPWQSSGVLDHDGQTAALKGDKFQGGGQGFLDAEYGKEPGNLGNMVVGSPPFAQSDMRKGGSDLYLEWRRKNGRDDQSPSAQTFSDSPYGEQAGQLAEMSTGDLDAAVTSPPFLQTSGGVNTRPTGPLSDPKLHARHAAGNAAAEGYGKDEGNLGNMPEGILSSPPYAANDQRGGHTQVAAEKHVATHGYGETPGNVGNDDGETFWSAAKLIVEQTYALLKSGGHATWVVKGFVRKGSYVDFPHDWQRLCEAVGFITLHEHHAMLVEHHGSQMGFDGTTTTKKKQRKSFFRLLAEKKGSPKIDFETVFCMRKGE